MNIRKNIDYSEMYEELDMLMARQLPQMELYCEIGKAVCRRTEKGAAVMASEYLDKRYPDEKGFSPRSLRRMRDFYRTYENQPVLLPRAMKLRWIQNVMIMEAELTIELKIAFLSSISVVYSQILAEKEPDENSDFVKTGQLAKYGCYDRNSFQTNVIINLARNALLGREFDELMFALMMFQWYEYTLKSFDLC